MNYENDYNKTFSLCTNECNAGSMSYIPGEVIEWDHY
jgi:hypothetical protein